MKGARDLIDRRAAKDIGPKTWIRPWFMATKISDKYPCLYPRKSFLLVPHCTSKISRISAIFLDFLSTSTHIQNNSNTFCSSYCSFWSPNESFLSRFCLISRHFSCLIAINRLHFLPTLIMVLTVFLLIQWFAKLYWIFHLCESIVGKPFEER